MKLEYSGTCPRCKTEVALTASVRGTGNLMAELVGASPVACPACGAMVRLGRKQQPITVANVGIPVSPEVKAVQERFAALARQSGRQGYTTVALPSGDPRHGRL